MLKIYNKEIIEILSWACIQGYMQGCSLNHFEIAKELLLLLLSHLIVSDSLQPRGLQHIRLPCPLPNPGACWNSCPSSQWCHPTILYSVIPFSSSLQSFPESESFPMSLLFASGGQSIAASASASVLPINIQDWFPLGWTGWNSSQLKGLSRLFSDNTVQKHRFFRAQLSLWSTLTSIHDHWKNHSLY